MSNVRFWKGCCENSTNTANPEWIQVRIQVIFEFKKVISKIHECATLFQIGKMSHSKMKDVLNKSKAFVSKWCREDLSDPKNFYDKPRKGAPVTALTSENMSKLAACEGKLGQSVTVFRDKLSISTGSSQMVLRNSICLLVDVAFNLV